MRLRAIASEAARNTSTGTSHPLAFLVVFLAIGALLVGVDTAAALAILRSGYAFESSGASVVTIQTDRSVDPVRCQALATAAGVESVLAVRFPGSYLVPRNRPSNPLPLIEVVGDTYAMLEADRDPASAGALVSRRLAETLGVVRGSRIAVERGVEVPTAAIFPFPEDGRDQRLGAGLVFEAPPIGRFDECWIKLSPFTRTKTDILYYAIAGDVDVASPTQVVQLNTANGSNPAFGQAFRDRPTRSLSALVTVAGAILGFLAMWIRRIEIATWRAVGVRLGNAVLQSLLETIAWVIPGTLLLMTSALVTERVLLRHVDLWPVASHNLQNSLLLSVASLAGATTAVVFLDRRAQYRYFRDR